MLGHGPRARTAPSHYPRLPFHLVRLVQLVSSLIVGAIMVYFIRHLADEHYTTPWTFIFLLASSFLSIAALGFTMIMHCCIGLNPRLNLFINGSLTCIWGASWAILTWYMSWTLANMCDIQNWEDDTGIMVCRVYKSLFTFSLLGFLSTLAAFVLDLHVRRRQIKSGVYRLHDIDGVNSRSQNEQKFPAGLQFAPAGSNQGYSQPEGQYRYDTTYQPSYTH